MTGSLQINKNFINEEVDKISALVGNTPLYYINSLSTEKVKVYAKAEWMQIGGSVKARAANRIINQGLKGGFLSGKSLLDASSGNTAIAYAAIGAKLNIPIEICLPKNASQKRKEILTSLGAILHYTSEFEGTDGAQRVAREIYNSTREKYFYADQYNNSSNWEAHYYGTAEEIWNQTNGQLTHFVTALGTTGSFTGNALRFGELNENIKNVALQPDSPMHIFEGWKHLETAITPGIFTESRVDEYVQIESSESIDMIKFIARNEGLLLSPSSAGNLLGAKKIADTIKQGVIVTLLPDDITKYDEILKLIQ